MEARKLPNVTRKKGLSTGELLLLLGVLIVLLVFVFYALVFAVSTQFLGD